MLRLWDRNILPLNEVLVFHLQKIRITRIMATFQAIHVARGRIGRIGQLDALAAEVERPAVARAQKAFVLVLEIDRTTQVWADGSEGVDLIVISTNEPDPAHDII